MKTVLVTGGAGYIGSHTHHLLIENGYKVIVVDNLYSGFRWAIHPDAVFYEADIGDGELIQKILTQHQIQAVIHFAAHIEVGESMQDPMKYYLNNTVKTRQLIDLCAKAQVEQFVFSSTAAVYGEPTANPIPLQSSLQPINPYGRSKLMSEMILRDQSTIKPQFQHAILRYFNVAGAHPNGHIGQATPRATHLLKVTCEVATGKRSSMQVFGSDYPTKDGTCVRDYIHVMDLADLHLRALEHLSQNPLKSMTLNCGYGKGISVLELIRAVETVSQKKVSFDFADRRAGDPAKIYADVSQTLKELQWKPGYDDLLQICSSAYLWEKQLKL